MNDATIFMVGMMLLGPAIILVVGLIGRTTVRGMAKGALPGPAARRGCGLSVLLGICAFCGLMVATAGGAVHPPLVMTAAPYACDGALELQSRDYSYKPGQQGVSRNIYCIGADGERRDITLRAIGAATIYYTLIFFAVALVLLILVRLLKPRRPAGIDSPVLAELRQKMADRLHTDADIVRRPAAPPDAGGGSVEDRLRHLQSLREGGLISEAEYQTKRADILGGL